MTNNAENMAPKTADRLLRLVLFCCS